MTKQAVFYDCRNSERLSNTSPEEAIVELFDTSILWSGKLTEGKIATHCPVTVTGHAPATIGQEYLYSCAEHAVERFEESLSEDFGDFGDPEGDYPILEESVRDNLTKKLFEAFNEAAKTVTPWLCEVVEKKQYSAQEVYDILRDSNPEWFEEEYYER